MIFVTVGANPHPFNRLVKKVDELVKEKKINDIILQIGTTPYKPKYIKKVKVFWDEKNEYKSILKNCDLIISHAGLGNIIIAHENKKPIIVVPRQKKFNEHIDNHQMQIAEYMEKKGMCYAVYDIDKLEEAIKIARKMKIKTIKREKPEIFKIIEEKLKEWEN